MSYGKLERLQEALVSTTEAVKILRELTKTEPGYLEDLARVLDHLSDLQLHSGQSQEAQASLEELVSVLRSLAARDPSKREDLEQKIRRLEEFIHEKSTLSA
jgi:DNA-directed RNA polymerase subunit F